MASSPFPTQQPPGKYPTFIFFFFLFPLFLLLSCSPAAEMRADGHAGLATQNCHCIYPPPALGHLPVPCRLPGRCRGSAAIVEILGKAHVCGARIRPVRLGMEHPKSPRKGLSQPGGGKDFPWLCESSWRGKGKGKGKGREKEGEGERRGKGRMGKGKGKEGEGEREGWGRGEGEGEEKGEREGKRKGKEGKREGRGRRREEEGV